MGNDGLFYCKRVVVEAPGKVNLSLHITERTDDGYHLLETVMLAIDLCDVLVIGKRDDDDLRVTCSNPLAPENDMNIAYRAAMEFFAATGIAKQGLSVHIDKSIPVEAGLAGGSADAAAVIRGMDRLFETSLSDAQLREIGLRVGMDVPFCLMGGCAFAEGRGEILTPLPALPDCRITVAKPPTGTSTRYAFKLYDSFGGDVMQPDTHKLLDGIRSGDLNAVGSNMFNVFGELGIMEETETLRGIMLCAGALGSVLSGSGSAVIGLFAAEKAASKCLHLLREQVKDSWVTKPLEDGARVIHAS